MIRLATETDVPAIKQIADANRATIGFVNRAALLESIQRNQLLVAEYGFSQVVGFCNCWERRDGWVTIREICVASEWRGYGLAREMISQLNKPIRLKCPVDNLSNGFYARLGFTFKEVLPGKKRQLNLWELI